MPAPPAPYLVHPSPPTVLSGRVAVRFEIVPGATEYRADFRRVGAGWSPLFDWQASPDFDWYTQVLQDDRYEVRGFARNQDGESGASQTWTFVVRNVEIGPFLVVQDVKLPVVTIEEEPEMGRAEERSLSGRLLVTDMWSEKRAWSVTSGRMTESAAQAFRSAVRNAPVTVRGDAIGGTLLCWVRVLRVPYHRLSGGQFRRRLVLSIREA